MKNLVVLFSLLHAAISTSFIAPDQVPYDYPPVTDLRVIQEYYAQLAATHDAYFVMKAQRSSSRETCKLSPGSTIWIKENNAAGSTKLQAGKDFVSTDYVEISLFSPESVVKTILHLNYTNIIDEQLINEKAFLHAIKAVGVVELPVPTIYDIDRTKTSFTQMSAYCEARSLIMDYFVHPLHRVRPMIPDKTAFINTIARLGLEFLRNLHATGFVHGDVHTGNILYDASQDKMTFIDFGMAQPFVDQSGVHIKITDVKEIITSRWNPDLLSPWHLQANNREEYLQTPRDDLFRFAEVLYMMNIAGISSDPGKSYELTIEDYIDLKTLKTTVRGHTRRGRMLPVVNAFYEYTLDLQFGQPIAYEEWIHHFSENS